MALKECVAITTIKAMENDEERDSASGNVAKAPRPLTNATRTSKGVESAT